jgi:hypothetical protein
MSMIKLDFNPSPRTLRQFGLIGLFVFPALAALAYFRIGLFGPLSATPAHWTAYVLLILAAYCGLGAAAAPKLLRPLYVAMTVAFYPIGVVVFHVLMAVIYFLVLTPVGLLFKIIGRDTMHRRFDRSAATYWIPRKPPDDVKRYFRQF